MIDALPWLADINPGLWVVLAGVICALLPAGQLRKALVLLAPVFAGYIIFSLHPAGESVTGGVVQFGPVELTTLRIDGLSVVWGYLFCLAGLINGIYGLHERCRITDSAALIYTGAAIAGVLAGDLLSLFVFWEMTAISSVFLIWKGGPRAYAAGLRYLAFQVLSGVLLLAGAVMYGHANGGDFTFGFIGLDSAGGWLLLLAMGIKVGFPGLHMWMQDAYPKASITGTVILASFTTKLAIYALCRGFPGEDILIWIGAVMAFFPVVFALLENDMRRVLAYSLNNQLGIMVAGIGIGTALAINGVVGHVFVNVLLKGLLFMGIGAVMYRTGTAKASQLGGLFRSMPYTALFCIIGALSLAAVPLFAGFVTKAMIFTAAVEEHHYVPFAIMLLATAAMVVVCDLKVPYFTFFADDSGQRTEEAPWNMLVAMGIAATLCVALALPGGGYDMLYALMPEELKYPYKPYTWDHVVFQLQLLLAPLFLFALLRRFGRYPVQQPGELLDADWLYRRVGLGVANWGNGVWARMGAQYRRLRDDFLGVSGRKLYQVFSPAGATSEATPSGLPAVLTAGLLVVVLLVAYLAR